MRPNDQQGYRALLSVDLLSDEDAILDHPTYVVLGMF